MPWEPYPASASVAGDVRVLRRVESPQLGNSRDLVVYLPPSHGSGRRFPVLYMHDGQNLFDLATSNGAEWCVDETMEALAREGVEAIVVGVPSLSREHRRHEYGGEGADAYIAFLVDTVRPLVDGAFDTDPRRGATGTAGSSLGGVISLVALYLRPDVFGLAGVLSPAFWWSGRAFELVEARPAPGGRIWMDVGDSEGDDVARRRAYVEGFERMEALLRANGYDDESLRTVLERGGVHHESAWARRLPDALRFLLAR